MSEAEWTRYSRFVADKAMMAMKQQSLTQSALGRRMNRSQQYVSHILSGKENLTLETLAQLESALNITLLRQFLYVCGDDVSSGSLRFEEPIADYHTWGSSSLVTVNSCSGIVRRFETGDLPFIIIGDDSFKYLCKAARTGNGQYGLARELIGSYFANVWAISDSAFSLVRIFPGQSDGKVNREDYSIPCLGRRWIDNAVELGPGNFHLLEKGCDIASSFLKIALFDIWLSNEDRLNNNMNLLYSFDSRNIVAIDHAGIFNTGFNVPLLRLSPTDSVLYSDCFNYVSGGYVPDIDEMESFFRDKVLLCKQETANIWSMIPDQWHIRRADYDSLMEFVFSERWMKTVIDAFSDIVNQVSPML